MTKSELEKLAKDTWAWECVGESGSVQDGEQELVDLLVGVYNKAIEDAIEACDPSSYQREWIRDTLVELKIRE